MRWIVPFATLLIIILSGFHLGGCGGDDATPAGPAAACSLEIISPRAGDSMLGDDWVYIRWNKAGGDPAVRIELARGTDAPRLIVADYVPTTTPSSYAWHVSTLGLPSGADFRLRVTAREDTACFATVDSLEVLQVAGCHFTLMDSIPDLEAGETFRIEWSGYETTGEVDLSLYLTGPGGNPSDWVGDIAIELPDVGYFDWEVDTFHRGTYDFYRLRIVDSAIRFCEVFSPPIAIRDEVNCSVQITGISRDRVYAPGEEVPLVIDGVEFSGRADLRLYAGNLRVNGGLIVGNYDVSLGVYFWAVADFGWNEGNDRYHVRAYDAQDPYCWGETERFTITR